MIGVMVFPANPEKGYKYKKSPKKVLGLSNEEALDFSRGNTAINEFFYYRADYDKLDDKEIIKRSQEFFPTRNLSDPRKTGSGYTSGDKKWLIKVIHCDREWFRRVKGQ